MAKIKVSDPCPHCNTKSLIETKCDREKTVHYARLDCARCETFIRWVSNSEIDGKEKRITRNLKKIDYCEICLRKPYLLIEHHILPFKHYPKLDDDPTNRLKLCEGCHNLIHHLRTLAKTENKKI